MHRDFSDMLSALSAGEAEFLVVGAFAMAAHGCPRATGDLDIWIRPTPENARRVWDALAKFGAPIRSLRIEDLSLTDSVLQIGLPPVRIDILTSIDGVAFDVAWERRVPIEVRGTTIPVLGRDDLAANKRASGRPQDLADLAWLEGRK